MIILIIVAIPFGFFYVLNNGNPCTKYLADEMFQFIWRKKVHRNEIEESHYVEPKYLINNGYYHGHYWLSLKVNLIQPIITEYPKKGNRLSNF